MRPLTLATAYVDQIVEDVDQIVEEGKDAPKQTATTKDLGGPAAPPGSSQRSILSFFKKAAAKQQ